MQPHKTFPSVLFEECYNDIIIHLYETHLFGRVSAM